MAGVVPLKSCDKLATSCPADISVIPATSPSRWTLVAMRGHASRKAIVLKQLSNKVNIK